MDSNNAKPKISSAFPSITDALMQIPTTATRPSSEEAAVSVGASSGSVNMVLDMPWIPNS
jgi:hypothetical protein